MRTLHRKVNLRVLFHGVWSGEIWKQEDQLRNEVRRSRMRSPKWRPKCPSASPFAVTWSREKQAPLLRRPLTK